MTDRTMTSSPGDVRPTIPTISLGVVIAMLLTVAAGAVVAMAALPSLLPGLTQSLLDSDQTAYWYLSRASGFVAYGLLWISMVSGLLITNRMARVWPGGPVAFDLHQFTSLLALAVTLFHALILLGSRYTHYTIAQLLLPFGSDNYRPLWVGIGQVAFYALIIVSFTFYVRRIISMGVWRLIHLTSFALFVMTIAHGVLSGTDSSTNWASLLYWFGAGSTLFLTVYRVLVAKVAVQA